VDVEAMLATEPTLEAGVEPFDGGDEPAPNVPEPQPSTGGADAGVDTDESTPDGAGPQTASYGACAISTPRRTHGSQLVVTALLAGLALLRPRRRRNRRPARG
jgi:hypothetical protein